MKQLGQKGGPSRELMEIKDESDEERKDIEEEKYDRVEEFNSKHTSKKQIRKPIVDPSGNRDAVDMNENEYIKMTSEILSL